MNLKNSWITPLTAILSLILLSSNATAVPTASFEGKNIADNEVVNGKNIPGDEGNWNFMMNMIDDCADKDFFSCMGVKIVTAMDRADKMSDIQVIDGVSLVKAQHLDDGRNGRALLTEEDVQNSLDQDPAQKTSRLLEFLVEVASRFFKSHVIQFKLPQFSPDDVQRALQEARGKKKIFKSLAPILLGLTAKLLLVSKIGLLVVGFLALKALVVSKLALLLAGFGAFQRLLGGGGLGSLGGKTSWTTGGGSGQWNTGGSGWTGGNTGGWSVSGSGGSPGYYRSFDTGAPVDAHEMAYKAQVPQEVSQ